MNSNLNDLQEAYLNGLRQMTGAGAKKKPAVEAPSDRLGLGSRRGTQGKEYAFFDNKSQAQAQMKEMFSNKTMIMSFIFWLIIMYGLYTVSGYIFVGLRVSFDDADIAGECKETFRPNRETNLDRIFRYPRGDSGPYIARFSSDQSPIEDYPIDSNKLPPLVTAAGSAQFFLLQGLIKHIHDDLKEEHADLQLIVYDIGLYRRERELIEDYCGCEVRNVDYSVYPDHVAYTNNFAWRPLVLQSLLEEFGAVAYVEPTTRFKSSNSLNFLRSRGKNHYMLWDTGAFTSVVGYTHKSTFLYLNETRCTYLEAGMIDSQVLVLYKTNTTWHTVMKPWLKCALMPDCIAPRWSRLDGCLHFRRPRTTGCHRFDMSVLSIIVNRGSQLTAQQKRNIPPRLTYVSEDTPHLFPEQPWTYTQLLMLLSIPAAFCVLVRQTLLKKLLTR
ncbi:hypothetical protein BaRGS_00031946 [Batillaria attramentaria]|uniref:Uncharacterized protein n=1 Tax=Batillaria attramentaria TaxID=370345 RepID=A0ABD0JPY1_9CAEN